MLIWLSTNVCPLFEIADCDFVFRTVALSDQFSSYNLGNDPAFLAKVTKTMFSHYLATYIT